MNVPLENISFLYGGKIISVKSFKSICVPAIVRPTLSAYDIWAERILILLHGVLLSYLDKKITKLFRNDYLLHFKFTIYGFLDFISVIHKTGLMLIDELLIFLVWYILYVYKDEKYYL